MSIRILLLSIFILSLSNCRPVKDILIEEKKSLKNISDYKLLKNIIDSSLNYNNLYFKKLDVNAQINGNSFNFKGNLWISKDSVIVASVIPLMGIEMYRVQFSEDKIRILDRTKRKVINTDYSILSKIIQFDIDYNLLQSILSNNIFCINDNSNQECLKRFKNYIVNNNYSFRSIKDRKLNKLDKKERSDDIIYQEFQIDGLSFRVKQSILQLINSDQKFNIQYSEFKRFSDSLLYPSKILLSGNKFSDRFIIDINVSNLIRNDDKRLYFKIPEKYTVIEK